MLDPGIGFGKTQEQSLIVLARLGRVRQRSACRYWSAPRAKLFIASVVAVGAASALGGSIAAHLIAAQRGARIIRTHDVAETVQALRVRLRSRTKQ